MSEEEKKAVEEMKRCIKYGIDLKNNKDVYEIEIIEIYEIILNLLAKKDKEIQYQKEINKTEQDRHKQTEKSLKGQLKKKDIEIEKLKVLFAQSTAERVITSLKDSKKSKEDLEMLFNGCQIEIEKKDKIIDLMAIAIGNEPLPTEEYCIFRNFDCPAVGGNRDCKECVKQYFERKLEEDK